MIDIGRCLNIPYLFAKITGRGTYPYSIRGDGVGRYRKETRVFLHGIPGVCTARVASLIHGGFLSFRFLLKIGMKCPSVGWKRSLGSGSAMVHYCSALFGL